MFRAPHVSPPLPSALRGLLVCLCLCALPAPARASEPPRPPERFEEACANQDKASCVGLGVLYGVARDERQDVRLHEQACTGGSAADCDTLGDLYDEGRGVSEDDSQAARLYEQACTGGVARGCNNLGILYQEGRGVTQDPSRAARLYEQACTAGYPNACTNLGLLHVRGRGVAQDAGRAATFFQQSCEAGRADACVLLSALHVAGKGIPRDMSRAARFSQKACALGDEGGCVRAQRLVDYAERENNARGLWNQGTRLRLILTLGGQFGGDKLADVTFSDGSSKELTAGGGVNLAAGLVLEPLGGTVHLLQLQGTVGFNGGFAGAEKTWLNWNRTAWELLAFYAYRPLSVRFGGGVQYNTAVSLSGEGGFDGLQVPFANAAGWIAQADWHSDFFSFYLRYTRISYTPEGGGTAIPGSSFGLGVSYLFRIL